MAHTGRNDTCPCGSGKKYKKCCESKQQSRRANNVMLIVVGGLMVAGLIAGITAFTTDRGHSQPAAGRVWSPEHGHYH
jgi:phosphotransferase system  glucose/maltose/N-acetylglucosamine-specific IIC component